VAAGRSTYRALVRLYPRDFRSEYGDDLDQLFADLVDRDGAAAAWRRTVVDLAATVPRYRLETLMSSRRSTAALVAIIAGLVVGAVAILAAGFGLVAAVLLLLAVGIAAAEHSRLARSLRPADRDHRHRLWIVSAVLALVAIAVLVVAMVDLGGEAQWPMGRVLVYNVVFLGAAIMALAAFVVGLRPSRTA
jgi:hypothetical protein